MAIPTREALSGFIATDPQLTETTGGGHRFYARVGIEQFQRNEDGSFTQLESEFTNLVMFDKAAQRAAEKFQKGDNFIAEGRSNTHEYQGEQREQFIASRIGHDNN
ncbi:MAG: single-stranded DNA-binding protein, partial [Propioniciclava sp.]